MHAPATCPLDLSAQDRRLAQLSVLKMAVLLSVLVLAVWVIPLELVSELRLPQLVCWTGLH